MPVSASLVLKEVLNEEFTCYKYIKEVPGVEVLYIKKSLYMYLLHSTDGRIFVLLSCTVFCQVRGLRCISNEKSHRALRIYFP